MKKRQISFAIMMITIISILAACRSLHTQSAKTLKINGIENFQPISSGKENYLLYYPADIRANQNNTIVKEINKKGDLIRQYEIEDKSFRRMEVHQKPNDLERLYISLFGEATFDNYYYIYELTYKKFHKVALDYFDYIVGVSHILHYGKDILFQTLVSHKTGEQNYNPLIQSFQMSISDATTKESFETEYGNVPRSLPLVQFQDKILYANSGQYKETYENFGVGVIDLEKQSVSYLSPQKNVDLIPLYATKEYAFILNEFSGGELYVYDQNFNYQTYLPFQDIPAPEQFYLESCQPLFLNETTALYAVRSQTKGILLGLMFFRAIPEFQILEKDYMEPQSEYRLLYQDCHEKEIYLIRSNMRQESLLILSSETLELLHEIPIADAHLLDFVVKN